MASRGPGADLVVHIAFPYGLTSPVAGPGQPYNCNSAARAAYVEACTRELNSLGEDIADRPVRALRLGVGASISKPDDIAALVRAVKSKLSLQPGAEVSLEVNPVTVGTPSLGAWHAAGINRILLQMRSSHDQELQSLGLRQRHDDSVHAFDFLRRFGLANVDVRLSYGLPGQSLASWKHSLLAAADELVPHISALPLGADNNYTLVPQKDAGGQQTGLAGAAGGQAGPAAQDMATQIAGATHAAVRPDADWPDAGLLQQMRELACSLLAGRGYHEYALGHFVHKNMLHAVDVFATQLRAGAGLLGLGAGAQSRYDGFLYENTADFDRYVAHADDFESIMVNPRREGTGYTQWLQARAALDSLGGFALADLDSPADPELQSWLDTESSAGRLDFQPDSASWIYSDAGKRARLQELGDQELL